MSVDRTFNWIPSHDERSRAFAIRPTLTTLNTRKRNKQWRVGPILDQGYEGACVGYGWAAEALSTPVPVKLDRIRPDVPRDPDQFAKFLYNSAKRLDPWEGEDYDGTSVLAGAKAVRNIGVLKEFRWAFSVDDVVNSVLAKGPVVLGTYWRDGMYEAPGGILRVEGEIVGGHCYLAVGFAYKWESLDYEDGIIVQNSWGASWGKNGLAAIKVSDLGGLLRQDGEACVPSIRSYGYHKP